MLGLAPVGARRPDPASRGSGYHPRPHPAPHPFVPPGESAESQHNRRQQATADSNGWHPAVRSTTADDRRAASAPAWNHVRIEGVRGSNPLSSTRAVLLEPWPSKAMVCRSALGSFVHAAPPSAAGLLVLVILWPGLVACVCLRWSWKIKLAASISIRSRTGSASSWRVISSPSTYSLVKISLFRARLRLVPPWA